MSEPLKCYAVCSGAYSDCTPHEGQFVQVTKRGPSMEVLRVTYVVEPVQTDDSLAFAGIDHALVIVR